MDTTNNELNTEIQRILYPETPPNLGTKDTNTVEKYKKYMYYNQRHNLRTTQFSYTALIDPGMIIMLQHFYNETIVRPNKIDEFTLGLSLERALFNDFKIVHI